MADNSRRFKLGLDEDSDSLWERVQQHMREQGEDPDAVLAQAAENLRAWEALPAEEKERRRTASIAEWEAWEATVDDWGRPLKQKP